jgi:DNA-directed RNA polymerase specialized sigma24 family protein
MSEHHKNLNANAPEHAHMAQLARALPTMCRQASELRKVYGYSGREIANRLGIPETAVEEHLIQAAWPSMHAIDPAQGLGPCPSSKWF